MKNLFITNTITKFKTTNIPLDTLIYPIGKNDLDNHFNKIKEIIEKLEIETVYCDSKYIYDHYKDKLPQIKRLTCDIPAYTFTNYDTSLNLRRICIAGYLTVLFFSLFHDTLFSIAVIIVLIAFWFLIEKIILSSKWTCHSKNFINL
jgi:hypothetical protein